ncbi:hypothetical protein KJ988_09970, partial [bacterium]|nr:hypothetical protein [bacterium]
RQITRLLLHGNSPTIFYFYELLQKSKDDFEQRHDYKVLQRENNREPSITDELINYSNEGLLNYEARLYNDLQTLPMDNQTYKDFNELHQAVEKEISRRGIDDDLF